MGLGKFHIIGNGRVDTLSYFGKYVDGVQDY